MMRVDPDRSRRYIERINALNESQNQARWLESLTPEHRAAHERGLLCGACIATSLADMRRSLARRAAGQEDTDG